MIPEPFLLWSSSLRRTRALCGLAAPAQLVCWVMLAGSSLVQVQRRACAKAGGDPSNAPLWCCRAAPAWAGVAVQAGAPEGLGARNSMECRRGGDL